jgi:HAD superfamily hydrolase (TIGR01509 family)
MASINYNKLLGDQMNFKNQISAIIFDCDGVMFDSRQANINFYNHILKKFNLPPMNKNDEYFVHIHTAKESVEQIFKGTPFGEEAEAYRPEIDYTSFIKYMVMEPGLKELLGILKPRFGLAVATNRSNTIQSVLKAFDLTQYFDIVVSSLNVSKPKPDPESVFKILDYFHVKPEETIYIGDSIVDYETARSAGVPFVSYKNSGLKTPQKISHLLELLDILSEKGNQIED